MDFLSELTSSVNPLPLPDVMEVDSLRGKCFSETTNQDGHCDGYALFISVLEHGLPPDLNLNHNTYSMLPRINVRRESMARGTKKHFYFARA